MRSNVEESRLTSDATTAPVRLSTFGKALSLLTPAEKRRGLVVLVLVVFMAFFEMVGIASIMPFLSVLGNPGIIDENPYLAMAYEWSGAQSTNRFLFFLALVALMFVLFSAFMRVLTHYVLNRYTQMRRHSVSVRMLSVYLRQPYEFFLEQNSSDLTKTILSESDQLIMNVIFPAFQMLAYTLVTIAIIVLLIMIDPLLALILAAGLGGTYALIYFSVRGYLTRIGRLRKEANKARFKVASESFGGIKDIKLLGREDAYLAAFKPSSKAFSGYQATNKTLSIVPKFIIEALGIGAVLALCLWLMAGGDDLGGILPILGVYALAGYKLLPAIQNIYSGLAKFRFGAAVVDDIHDQYWTRKQSCQKTKAGSTALKPQVAIKINNLGYHYPGADRPALTGINLEIPVGSSVGIIGQTGAGKTTLVDVILGLLQPTAGQITVDDIPVSQDNLREWQACLGYVPQDIFLADATVAENIAFGVLKEQIDREKVREVARMAQIDQFIEDELPLQYATIVGERGVRLSGGQKQRLGVARALYTNPDILVFDEATSALDNETEAAVMQAIDQLTGEKTIVLIAHRLTTVKNCDLAIQLDRGAIERLGVSTDLIGNN